MKLPYLILLLTSFLSCRNDNVLFYPEYAVNLFSNYPDLKSDGSGEFKKGRGYGSISYQPDGAVTYPSLYLSNEDPINGREIIFISGYEIEKDFRKLYFKLNINYIEKDLKNLEIRLIPVKEKPPLNELNYKTLTSDETADYQNQFKYYFTLRRSKINYYIEEIPLDKSKRELIFNITNAIPFIRNGFLLIIPDRSAPDYITSSRSILSDSGILEFASPEWEYFDGHIPEHFTINNYKWKSIINRGYGSKKYSPEFRGILK